MARLPRLSLPGVLHYLLQRGHNGAAIVHDGQDVEQLLQILREAALGHGVVLHAYAVTGPELRVLATPDSDSGISRMMQSVGRRYAAGFNRRHGRSGSLWDGRFRSALIESGPRCLMALRQIDALGVRVPPPGDADTDEQPQLAAIEQPLQALVRSSAAHRSGGRRDVALVDPPVYWQLGNTPFDRELRYRQLLAEPLPQGALAELDQAVAGAWAWGSPQFLQGLSEQTSRPLAPRPRGRPRR